MYEGSASTRCASAVGLAIEKTSTSSPPTVLAMDARSLVDAATRILAPAGCGNSSAAASSVSGRRGFMGSLLERRGRVGPQGIDDAQREGVHRGRRFERAFGCSRGEMVPVQAERGRLFH